jgi:outer membrane protein insertion porin family
MSNLIFFKNVCLLFTVFCMLSACNTSKYINSENNERLLVKNQLVINAPAKFGSNFELKYNLETLYKQVPNRKFLYFTNIKTGIFYHRLLKNKKNKAAKWMYRQWAEAPAIYKEELTQKTAQNFENYMKQRGYFNAKCTYSTLFTGTKAKVKYTLDFNEPYKINTVNFVSRDSTIKQILDEIALNSLLKPRGNLDGQVFESEKIRITNDLKNKGYAYFIPNFVEFIGDTTGTKTDVTIEVLPLNDSTNHRAFKVGKVAVFSSLIPDYSSIRKDTTIGGVYIASADPVFLVKPQRLYDAIAFQPGKIYKQEDFDQTYRNLNALGIFKFVSVKTVQDSLNPERLDITISFSPSKNFRPSLGASLNYTTTNQYFGIAGEGGLEFRNLARGAEHLSMVLGYNIEFDVTNRQRLVNSQEFKFQNDLTIPRFFDYAGFWRNLNRIPFGRNKKLVANSFYKTLKSDANARLSLGYNFFDINNFYQSNIFHASLGYDLKTKKKGQYSIDHLGIDVVIPKIDTGFIVIFGNNDYILKTLSNQLFTGFVLRSFNYSLTGVNNHFGERWNFRFGQELSGGEQYLLKELYQVITKKNKLSEIFGLEFSKFLRLEIDGSYTRDFRRNVSAVFRMGSGVILPFGDSQFAPYVKQFSIGGPSSLRAWRIREIGPGRANDINKPYRAPFSQTGDFKFEFNAELRFPIFWYLKGAAFLDGGNIWTLRKENDRFGSQLNINSYKNIALGSGIGFRLDIGYAVIRFDIGYKLRWPYPDYFGNHWVGQHQRDLFVFYKKENGEIINDIKSENRFNLNLAVGYPF